MLQRIREEVANRDKKFAYLDEAGLYLIQKGDSADAIAVQAELDTFRQYYRQVMEKLTLTKVKLEAKEVIFYCFQRVKCTNKISEVEVCWLWIFV